MSVTYRGHTYEVSTIQQICALWIQWLKDESCARQV